MPGILGLVSLRPVSECQAFVQAMIASMRHQPFYVTGVSSDPPVGIYGGWVAHPNSFAQCQCESDKGVILSGEYYDQEDRSVRELYQTYGENFVKELNGLFSGFLIDQSQGSAFLFNDRYGLDRLYIAQTEDAFYFASEAKALLRVLPKARAFADEGVADFLAFGCTTGTRTLFRGIELLPPGSCWVFRNSEIVKRSYFSPSEWENQDKLSHADFDKVFREAIYKHLPKYFATSGKLGLSLTAGLDSRLLLTADTKGANNIVCYTYDGSSGKTRDTELAARVATVAGLRHQILRLKEDFFSEFATLAEQTVYLTDGCFGITGAHELYLSRAARALAPVRLTGVFGGEIFRSVSTFKPLGLDTRSFEPLFAEKAGHETRDLSAVNEHPVSRAAFKEIPWNLFGSMAACRTQLTFRTPYLDNELVALAYRMPEELRLTSRLFEGAIRMKAPALAMVPTDLAMLGGTGRFDRAWAKLTFKLEYFCNDGTPHWLSFADPLLKRATGKHKYLHYRSWFRSELSGYVNDALRSVSVKQNNIWNSKFVAALAEAHYKGLRNYVQEINAVLLLDAVERLLLKAPHSMENSVY